MDNKAMKNGDQHKAEGFIDRVKGEAKDQYGKLANDHSKQAEGKWDKAKGAAKDALGDFKNKMNDDRA